MSWGSNKPATAENQSKSSDDDLNNRLSALNDLARAQSFYLTGENQKCVDLATHALASKPTEQLKLDFYVTRAHAHQKLSKWKDAINDFKLAEKQKQFSPLSYYDMARCYSGAKDYETAIVVYSKFINELNSKFRHGPRPLDRAEIEHRMRKGDNIPIEEINEGHANHLLGSAIKRRGYAYEHLGRYKEAVSEYRRAWSLEGGPQFPKFRAPSEAERAEAIKTVAASTKKLKEFPQDYRLSMLRGQAYLGLMNYPSALAALNNALPHIPPQDRENRHKAEFLISVGYDALGKLKEECTSLRGMFNFDPAKEESRTYGSPLILLSSPNSFFYPLDDLIKERGHTLEKAKGDKAESLMWTMGLLELSRWRKSAAQSYFERVLEYVKPGTPKRIEALLYLTIIYRRQEQTDRSRMIKEQAAKQCVDPLDKAILNYFNGEATTAQVVALCAGDKAKETRVRLLMGFDDASSASGISCLKWVADNGVTNEQKLAAQASLAINLLMGSPRTKSSSTPPPNAD